MNSGICGQMTTSRKCGIPTPPGLSRVRGFGEGGGDVAQLL